MATTKRRPIVWYIHPGQILREEKRGITADTALRLSRFFGTSPEFWMNAQAFYEVRLVASKLEPELRRIRPQQAVE